ncbi:hypothetical protein QBC35DRAFT_118171 [Podospora australis]|uniref:Uncharacterized protein n=1 Tax=Podospora australis TaxID=1536484 RepID=A0AAN7AJZ5_9PEZI|nr:hypothetical protein QBC35DRAFT_118171 [Podospora australis]
MRVGICTVEVSSLHAPPTTFSATVTWLAATSSFFPKKPVQYGYGPVHDLPTPPSTSRPSPPLIYKEPGYKAPLSTPRGSSPFNQPMSAPHRGLPPPAALPPVQQNPGPGPSQPPLSAPSSHTQSLGQLPSAPSWHEESMRAWLVAKAEEDKRRQEEERTRQESYRLEQRKMEHEILKTSLSGGIPPPLVPVVFAGMGGGALSPAALDWAQQFMISQSGQQHPPALMPPGTVSSDHQRRDSQAQAYPQYPPSGGVPSTPGSAQGPPSSFMSGYPGSPGRPRGLSMPGTMGSRTHGSASTLPNLNTNVPGGSSSASAAASHVGVQHQEPQPSPSIYFHHWQPPTTQAGGGRGGPDQPATPSVGESPRKRKAVGPQTAAPPPSTQRLRSPPFSQQSAALSNPPPGRRRGHSRQRSDLGSYRSGGRGRGESSGPGLGLGREMSPMHTSGASSARDSEQPSSSSQHQQAQGQSQQIPPVRPLPSQQQAPTRTGAHSVSSLLSSDNNPPSPQMGTHHFSASAGPSLETRHFQQHQHQHQQQQQQPPPPPPPQQQQHAFHQQHQQHQHQQQQQQAQYGEGERRSSEEKLRGGGVPGSAATRAGDND